MTFHLLSLLLGPGLRADTASAQEGTPIHVVEWEGGAAGVASPSGYPMPRWLTPGDWWAAGGSEVVLGGAGTSLDSQFAVLYAAGMSPTRGFEVRLSGRLVGAPLSNTSSASVAPGDLRIGAAWFPWVPTPGLRSWGAGVEAHVDLPMLPEERAWGRQRPGGGARVLGSIDRASLVGSAALGIQADAHDGAPYALGATLGAQLAWSATPSVSLGAEARAILGGAHRTMLDLMVGPRLHRSSGAASSLDVQVGVYGDLAAGAVGGRILFGISGGFIDPAPLAAPPLAAFADEDHCPDAVETVNGWRDDDGCPDALADVRITATLEGSVIPSGAFVLTTKGDRRTGRAVGTHYQLELLPQTEWSVEASVAGGCVMGKGSFRAEEGPQEIVITLAHPATLALHVVDEHGRPATDATVRFSNALPPCAPLGTFTPDAHGRLEIPLGLGRWGVYFTAPGHLATTRGLDVVAPGRIELVAQLEPRKPERDLPAAVWLHEERVVFRDGLAFPPGAAVPDRAGAAALAELAALLVHEGSGRLSVRVDPHAEGGPPDPELAVRRAVALRALLVGFGLEGDRIAVEPVAWTAFTESEPATRTWVLTTDRSYPRVTIEWITP